jgi:hypothetical protein
MKVGKQPDQAELRDGAVELARGLGRVEIGHDGHALRAIRAALHQSAMKSL